MMWKVDREIFIHDGKVGVNLFKHLFDNTCINTWLIIGKENFC